MWSSGGLRLRRLSSREELEEARESMQTYTSRASYIYGLLVPHPSRRGVRPNPGGPRSES